MDNAINKFLHFSIFTGTRKGSALLSPTLIGTSHQISTAGVYRVDLKRPYAKTYYMVVNDKDPGQYNLYSYDDVPVGDYPSPCGSAKLDSTFQSFLEVNLSGYPPLFMELFPTKAAA